MLYYDTSHQVRVTARPVRVVTAGRGAPGVHPHTDHMHPYSRAAESRCSPSVSEWRTKDRTGVLGVNRRSAGAWCGRGSARATRGVGVCSVRRNPEGINAQNANLPNRERLSNLRRGSPLVAPSAVFSRPCLGEDVYLGSHPSEAVALLLCTILSWSSTPFPAPRLFV